MRSYPLAPVTGLLAAGIVTGHFAAAPLAGLLVALGAAALAALIHKPWRAGWVALTVFLAGWTHMVACAMVLHPHDLRRVVESETLEAEVWGRLVDAPTLKALDTPQGRVWLSSAVVRVEALQRERGGPEPARGLLLATLPAVLGPEYHDGRRVHLRGVLQPPPGPVAPGMFDYRSHLQHRGIHYLLRSRQTNEWSLTEPAAGPPPRPARFQAWARQALASGLPADDPAVEMLWAMLLGWRTGLTEEVAEPFMKSGTMHLFAISGLHIGMVTLALFMLLRLARLPRQWASLVVLPLLWFYIAATGWQASAARAGVMISVLLGGGMLQRPANHLNSLCAAGLLILAWEPRQLFQAGFQLSFMVVLSILLWCPLLLERLKPIWERDPLAVGGEPWPRRALRWTGRWICASVAVSVAAWVGSLPLIAWYFSWMTPVCVLANVVMVPISGLVVASGLGSLLTQAWWPGLGGLFNHSAWALMHLTLGASEWFAQWPGGHWAVARPPGWWLAAGYLAWLGAALPQAAGWWRRGLVAGLAVITVACAGLAPAWQRPSLTVLPLEDGYALAWREGRSAWLVDCGRPGPAQRQVVPFLHAQGVNRLAGLILTHGDLGQIGGADFIEATLHPRQLLHGPLNFRSPYYRDWLARHQAHPGRRVVAAGDTLGPWRVLHPAADDDFNAADDGTLVWRHDVPHGRCLLLGDLGRAGQNRLAERWPPEELRADILITGLPENGEPLADGLLRLVQPRLVIVTDSLYPADRRASTRFLQRLARQRVEVWCTRLCGAVTVEFHSRGWQARAMDGRVTRREELPGWQAPAPAPEEEE